MPPKLKTTTGAGLAGGGGTGTTARLVRTSTRLGPAVRTPLHATSTVIRTTGATTTEAPGIIAENTEKTLTLCLQPTATTVSTHAPKEAHPTTGAIPNVVGITAHQKLERIIRATGATMGRTVTRMVQVTTGVQWEAPGATAVSKERAKRLPPMATSASPLANTTAAETITGVTSIITARTTVRRRTG